MFSFSTTKLLYILHLLLFLILILSIFLLCISIISCNWLLFVLNYSQVYSSYFIFNKLYLHSLHYFIFYFYNYISRHYILFYNLYILSNCYFYFYVICYILWAAYTNLLTIFYFYIYNYFLVVLYFCYDVTVCIFRLSFSFNDNA
jgi:hypothetical protein